MVCCIVFLQRNSGVLYCTGFLDISSGSCNYYSVRLTDANQHLGTFSPKDLCQTRLAFWKYDDFLAHVRVFHVLQGAKRAWEYRKFSQNTVLAQVNCPHEFQCTHEINLPVTYLNLGFLCLPHCLEMLVRSSDIRYLLTSPVRPYFLIVKGFRCFFGLTTGFKT